MAFVLQFAPQDFVNIPKHGTIQYHPSLLPKYRGPSSINWPIIARRDARPASRSSVRPTASTKARSILQKETRGRPRTTRSATVYFNRLFPMGVEAMLEAADLVVAGKHTETRPGRVAGVSYEGWFREAEAKINWANHVDFVHNLIRGCNPAPGAWTTYNGQKMQIFDARKHAFRRFARRQAARSARSPEVTEASFRVTAQGGAIEVLRARGADGKKVSGGEFARRTGSPRARPAGHLNRAKVTPFRAVSSKTARYSAGRLT